MNYKIRNNKEIKKSIFDGLTEALEISKGKKTKQRRTDNEQLITNNEKQNMKHSKEIKRLNNK